MSFRRQLARPRGALGLLAGEVLAWTNRELNAWTVSLLAPASNARVLEIGFGPGVGVRLAAMRARRGLVAGIDPSSMMLRRARFRNRTRLRRGRLDLRRGSVIALPWADRSFTHAFAVNSFFEWPDPARGLAEVARVLRSGGQVALTTQARWTHDAAEVEAVGRHALAMLEAAGFEDLRMEERALRPHTAVCLLGRLRD